MQKIVIRIGELSFAATLNDTKTAQAVSAALPIQARVSLWGQEIYFEIPVKAELEKDVAKEVVRAGDIGYWPEGACFCVFWGLTPASRGDEIRPASPVNIIGQLKGDLSALNQVKTKQKVEVRKND